MGNEGFNNLLLSIQNRIKKLESNIAALKINVTWQAAKVESGNQQAAASLATSQQDLVNEEVAIVEFRQFYAALKRNWSKVNDRIIGHVVWAPPITGLTTPHGYTQDVCVIKLDKERFLPNFRGNAIDLGVY